MVSPSPLRSSSWNPSCACNRNLFSCCTGILPCPSWSNTANALNTSPWLGHSLLSDDRLHASSIIVRKYVLSNSFRSIMRSEGVQLQLGLLLTASSIFSPPKPIDLSSYSSICVCTAIITWGIMASSLLLLILHYWTPQMLHQTLQIQEMNCLPLLVFTFLVNAW